MISIADKKKINFIFKKGKSFACPAFVCYYIKGTNVNKTVIITSKKVGNAVKRNRARRIIREAFRKIEPQILSGFFDIIFVARAANKDYKSADIEKMMQNHLLSKLNGNVKLK